MPIVRIRRGLLMIHAADDLTTSALCGVPIDRKAMVGKHVPVTCRDCREVLGRVRYSFCESVGASGSSPMHIRILTPQGRFMGGGADTPALCGRVMAWDILGEVNEATAGDRSTCPSCALTYRQSAQIQARLQPTPA